MPSFICPYCHAHVHYAFTHRREYSRRQKSAEELDEENYLIKVTLKPYLDTLEPHEVVRIRELADLFKTDRVRPGLARAIAAYLRSAGWVQTRTAQGRHWWRPDAFATRAR